MPFQRNPISSKNNKRDSPDDGWQVWASYNNINNQSFDSFLGTFNVPTDPGWYCAAKWKD
jgi:hypothetical protein